MNDHYKSIWATSLSVQTVTKSHFPFANSIPINNPNTSLAAHVCNLIFYIKKKKKETQKDYCQHRAAKLCNLNS